MDNLSVCASSVVEFKPKTNFGTQKGKTVIPKSTETLHLPKKSIDATTCTPTKKHQEVQMESSNILFIPKNNNEQNILLHLRKKLCIVEKELATGCFPVLPSAPTIYNVQPFQKIILDGTDENSILLMTWLSKHNDTMPTLAACLVPHHIGWCEHINQCIVLFVPQRTSTAKIAYLEDKSLKIHINSCLLNLRTNSFQKNIFCGSTYACDIHIWELEYNYGYNKPSTCLREICKAKSLHGMVTDMDWLEENCLVTVHANSYIVKWLLMANNLTERHSCLLQHQLYVKDEIKNIVCTSLNKFVIGTKNGLILCCSFNDLSSKVTTLKITPLRKHIFSVMSLLKFQTNDEVIVVSCDLSGQVYYHNLSMLNINVSVNVSPNVQYLLKIIVK